MFEWRFLLFLTYDINLSSYCPPLVPRCNSKLFRVDSFNTHSIYPASVSDQVLAFVQHRPEVDHKTPDSVCSVSLTPDASSRTE